MRFKLAILNVLAKCPGGRATLDDVRREVRVIIASGDQTEQLKRFSALGEIDIFQSGLVLRDDAGLQITDAGLSLLHSLESSSGLVAEKRRFLAGEWRRFFSEAIPYHKTERFVGGVGGAAFALLTLLVVVTCIGAAIALGQIKSLKSDIAMLHRELLPLKERLARFEQVEKTKREQEQQDETKSGVDKNRPSGDIRAEQSALNLSREEIQLIKDYVKPAPVAGAVAPAINVGDPVEGAMIPLPSQLTDKVPKLLGGKFTIRNGTIIIVKRDSRQADAVLTPN